MRWFGIQVDRMNSDDRRNIDFYNSKLLEYGENFKALDWGSKTSQISRFKVLTEIGMVSGDSILDVGCGLADFYEWMKVSKFNFKYTGIDITPEMAKKAQARFPNISIINTTIFDNFNSNRCFDYVMASGIFVFREKNPEQYLFSTIKKMFSLCDKGIAFNSLSSWSKDQAIDEYYADPTRTISFCRELTPSVVLRHDYHPGDFTIYMYKRKAS